MKTVSFLAIIAGASIFLSFLYSCETRKQAAQKEKPQINRDSLQQVVRGERLVLSRARCLDCHSQRNWDVFGGPIIPGTEGMGGLKFNEHFGAIAGTVYARNITPTAIGAWTDEELVRAITQGISQNGDTLHPIMPYTHYNKMTKEEILDIIAYIRTLKPRASTIPERKLTVRISQIYPGERLVQNIENNKKPFDIDKVKYGEYLVETAGCADCHTPVNEKRVFLPEKMLAGGMKFKHEKFTSVTGNITPDTATGIGGWTEEVFLIKFKSYRDPEFYNYNPGRKNSFMPWLSFSRMDDYDLKAIYAYLRTMKPVINQVEKFPE